MPTKTRAAKKAAKFPAAKFPAAKFPAATSPPAKPASVRVLATTLAYELVANLDAAIVNADQLDASRQLHLLDLLFDLRKISRGMKVAFTVTPR